MSDVHHFKETINAGQLQVSNTASEVNSTGCFVMRLTDFPAYQTLGANFEFARVNKCTIEFIPKYNMQLNLGGGASTSVTGTMVTGIDQIPIYTTGSGGFTPASTWINDVSNDTGVTSASAVQTSLTTSYIRGLQGSREKELYKKHRISFYPAFYDYVMTGTGTGTIAGISNPVPASANTTWGTNGCVERKIKKWISINTLQSSASPTGALNVGPLYFGPVYALDVNQPAASDVDTVLYDIRMTYSISFKRLKGV